MMNTLIKVIALLFITFVFVIIIEAINRRAYKEINNNIDTLTGYLSLAATDDVRIPLESFTIREFKSIASFAYNMIEQRVQNESKLSSLNRELEEVVEQRNENLIVLKQQEEILRITEEFRKMIFESSPIPIIVMEADTYKYIDCNPAAVAAYRFDSKEEVLGKMPGDFSAPVQYDGTSSETKAVYYINEAKAKGSVVFEWLHQYMDGEKWDAEVHLLSFNIGDRKLLQFSLIDITERKQGEERIQSLLNEKELLLQEVHHRIKNNMNNIKGLLTLQLAAETNSSAAESLQSAENRVQSMIMLYDRLYCTDNYREMPLKDYIQPLIEQIVGSFPNRGIVSVETVMDDFILNVNILTPLGIIINELLTNIMKYAFAGRDKGLITVSSSLEGKHVSIIIKDDGVGIPETINFGKSTGFGLDLVGLLAEQTGGSIKIERGSGTAFVLEFDL